MIPKNKIISVLHPYVNKRGWAVNMMIYLSNLLQRENKLEFYTFSYDEKIFSKEINFNINCFNKIKTAYLIRNSDYIIIWNSPMQFVWVLSKVLFFSRAKLIWWHHHYPWYYKNTNVYTWFKKILEKLSIRFISEMISNSYYLKKCLFDIYKVDSKVLYPVLDTEYTLNKTKNIDYNSKIIFAYGRWVEWKNLEQVFQSYNFIKSQVPWLKLNIWWEGIELESFKEKYRDDTSVSFLWLLDKLSIIDNLQKSLVCLFPSKIDSFWMTIIESLSIWVPVVAFDINWVSEIIKSWQNWFLVKSSDEFTKRVLEILTDEALYNKLSNNALDIVNSFSWKNFEKQLQDIF